jgi:arginine:pyruvate transaminase
MRFASRIRPASPSGRSSWDIHGVAEEMMANGEEVIVLTVGDSDFASPKAAVDAVNDSLARGRTYYTAPAGDDPLRATIARQQSRLIGREIAAEQVIVTVGAQNALLIAAMCLLDPGDEVIVPEPLYSTYPGTLGLAGARMVTVASPAAQNFHPQVDSIAAAVTARTKAIFLATPNNPTGAVYRQDELRRIGDICKKHDLWLVSDEVYAGIVYEGRHFSAGSLVDIADRTVTIGSLSKSHAMAGWRLGWMVAPLALARQAERVSTWVTFGIPTFIQDAAVVALETQPDGMPELKEAYARRRQLFCDRLMNVPGIVPLWPEGGMFVMLDVSGSGLPAYEFAMGLVREKRVATVPADDFGASAQGYLRVNLGAADALIETAAERIADYAFALHEKKAAIRPHELLPD